MSCSHISQERHSSETCCHMTVAQTCSAVILLVCYIDMETHCEGRLRKGKISHEVTKGNFGCHCLLLSIVVK